MTFSTVELTALLSVLNIMGLPPHYNNFSIFTIFSFNAIVKGKSYFPDLIEIGPRTSLWWSAMLLHYGVTKSQFGLDGR